MRNQVNTNHLDFPFNQRWSMAAWRELYFTEGRGPGTAWDALRDAHMRLPSWFRTGLDPLATPASVRALDTGEGAAGDGKLPDGVAISIGSLA